MHLSRTIAPIFNKSIAILNVRKINSKTGYKNLARHCDLNSGPVIVDVSKNTFFDTRSYKYTITKQSFQMFVIISMVRQYPAVYFIFICCD